MTAAAPAPSNGKTLGIVALILAFLVSLVGIILGFVARAQSKRAGVSNGAATAAIVIGFIVLAIQLIFFVILPIAGFSVLASQCAELGTGVHDVNGVTVTCG